MVPMCQRNDNFITSWLCCLQAEAQSVAAKAHADRKSAETAKSAADKAKSAAEKAAKKADALAASLKKSLTEAEQVDPKTLIRTF